MVSLDSVLGQLRATRRRVVGELQELDKAIHAIQGLGLGGSSHPRRLSPEGRRRIVAAQKARWAKARQKRKS